MFSFDQLGVMYNWVEYSRLWLFILVCLFFAMIFYVLYFSCCRIKKKKKKGDCGCCRRGMKESKSYPLLNMLQNIKISQFSRKNSDVSTHWASSVEFFLNHVIQDCL
jgi:hypothetical protein